MERQFLLLLMAIGTLGSENDVTQTSEEARNQAETWHSNNFMYNYPMYTSTLSKREIYYTVPKGSIIYFSIGTIRQNGLLLSYNAWQYPFWFYGGEGRKSWYRIQGIQCRNRRTYCPKEIISKYSLLRKKIGPFGDEFWLSKAGLLNIISKPSKFNWLSFFQSGTKEISQFQILFWQFI